MNPSGSSPPAPKPLRSQRGPGRHTGNRRQPGRAHAGPVSPDGMRRAAASPALCAPSGHTSRSKSKTLKASVSRHVRERSTPIRGEQFSNSIAQKSEKVQHFLPHGQIWPSPPARPHLARARVRATTHAAPAARRQAAHWARVAPLVATSSTSTTRFPASSTPGRQA